MDIVGRSRVDQLFRASLLRDMRLANLECGAAQATHEEGGVLDLILVGRGVQVCAVEVSQPGLGGSDHHMVIMRCTLPGLHVRQPPWRWVEAHDAPWDKIGGELSGHMTALHGWFDGRSMSVRSQGEAKTLGDEVALLMGVIALGTIRRTGSPYGRFKCAGNRHHITPWWNPECTRALRNWRCARGGQGAPQAKYAFRKVLRREGRASWEKWVHYIEKEEQVQLQTRPAIFSAIKRHIRPMRRVSRILRVGRMSSEKRQQRAYGHYTSRHNRVWRGRRLLQKSGASICPSQAPTLRWRRAARRRVFPKA